jgi:NAD(P)-dependent dehydrogenase (short-subunit alcohol dehydrogenase family)
MKGIDGIVNTAGIYANMPFEKVTPAQWQRFVGVNMNGPYFMCHSALPHLRRAKRATIVNFASTSFLVPYPGMAHYAASKGGVVGFTRALAVELGPKIRANAICPGTIRTAMTQALYPNDKALEKAAGSRAPLGHIGEPEDIAETALFLTSDASSYITGTLITVAGGQMIY